MPQLRPLMVSVCCGIWSQKNLSQHQNRHSTVKRLSPLLSFPISIPALLLLAHMWDRLLFGILGMRCYLLVLYISNPAFYLRVITIGFHYLLEWIEKPQSSGPDWAITRLIGSQSDRSLWQETRMLITSSALVLTAGCVAGVWICSRNRSKLWNLSTSMRSLWHPRQWLSCEISMTVFWLVLRMDSFMVAVGLGGKWLSFCWFMLLNRTSAASVRSDLNNS